jgi:hypothetical protein
VSKTKFFLHFSDCSLLPSDVLIVEVLDLLKGVHQLQLLMLGIAIVGWGVFINAS